MGITAASYEFSVTVTYPFVKNPADWGQDGHRLFPRTRGCGMDSRVASDYERMTGDAKRC
jgi:hypothetical protein